MLKYLDTSFLLHIVQLYFSYVIFWVEVFDDPVLYPGVCVNS